VSENDKVTAHALQKLR